MTRYRSRAYAGAHDLRRMQALAAASFHHTSVRAGDLAWLSRYRTHRELALDVRLWVDGDRLVAWSFYRSNGGFNLLVGPDVEDEEALLDEMVAWISDAAATAVAAGDPLTSLYTYAIDTARSSHDRFLAAALTRRGFEPVPKLGGVLVRSLSDDVAPPSLPGGYRLATVDTAEDVVERVEAHRAAYPRSELTVGCYERVRQRWPYRSELDHVVVTDGGLVAAFCTAWIDEVNQSGHFEPVGTRPEHRRRGLAKAACQAALVALRTAGARTVEVGFDSEAGQATYRSLGFRPNWTDSVYEQRV